MWVVQVHLWVDGLSVVFALEVGIVTATLRRGAGGKTKRYLRWWVPRFLQVLANVPTNTRSQHGSCIATMEPRSL